MNSPHPSRSAARAFTLMEVILALAISAVVLAVINGVYFSALKLRNQTEAAYQRSLPLVHALSIMKNDLAGLMVPGGPLSGELQTTDSSTVVTVFPGERVTPEFHTNSGIVNDRSPFGDIQRVAYYLVSPTNRTEGRELHRVATRNLLSVAVERGEGRYLLSGVAEVVLQYHNGNTWITSWDSTLTTNLPSAIKVQLIMAGEDEALNRQYPMEIVVPVVVEGRTNSAGEAVEGGGS